MLNCECQKHQTITWRADFLLRLNYMMKLPSDFTPDCQIIISAAVKDVSNSYKKLWCQINYVLPSFSVIYWEEVLKFQ